MAAVRPHPYRICWCWKAWVSHVRRERNDKKIPLIRNRPCQAKFEAQVLERVGDAFCSYEGSRCDDRYNHDRHPCARTHPHRAKVQFVAHDDVRARQNSLDRFRRPVCSVIGEVIGYNSHLSRTIYREQ